MNPRTAARLACLLAVIAVACESSPSGPPTPPRWNPTTPGEPSTSGTGTPVETGWPVAGSTALVVDSFTVIEYHADCTWACPFLVYAPLIWVREPTGRSRAVVEAVEFTIPTQHVGCRTPGLSIDPGMTAPLNGIDPYVWANDLIFVSPKGVPVPDGLATARVLVRDERGERGVLEAEAPIRRGVLNPALPPLTWSC
jgi:hypothetical protein